ncbi:succinate dehydrogenase, cytochrome b556 subunit [Dichotomicrobium thermohalophilum]|uniref:Succinate dehydrogenase cytochrome b556 subunit n=1 Tax=Dichotomicrobium thermohalophilum TaxID=933063 RepID=A0A397Q5N8_9HYPH|nr:succinate dehydrogenase, cytochrome b556 subunit [Dichotomicrobium thermohalophilum]RIA56800.1 succinate dehydrogenase subunit C [Dichotomicrobium thermohalophilum]
MSEHAHERPLSPHLQIYRPVISMVMSIFHRITGTTLYLGMIVLAWWLIAAASGPDYYAVAMDWIGSVLGYIILLGLSWSVFHHALGGLRHFLWDTGRGFEIPTVLRLSWATLFGSLTLTVLFWAALLMTMGVI